MNYEIQIFIILASIFLAMELGRYIKRKPFNCEGCITFWASATYYLINKETIFLSLLYALASAMVAKATFGIYLRYIGYLK